MHNTATSFYYAVAMPPENQVTNPVVNLTGFSRRLLNAHLLSEEILNAAQETSRKTRKSLVRVLVDEKLVVHKLLAEFMSADSGIPLLDLKQVEVPHELFKEIVAKAEKHVKEFHMLPLNRRGKTMSVAIVDPYNKQLLDELQFATGFALEPVLAEADQLAQTIEKIATITSTSSLVLEDVNLDGADQITVAEINTTQDLTKQDAEDAPVVKFINKILFDAIQRGASDIHFEPYEKNFRVRYRMDGILKEVASPPVGLTPRISARLKVMSRLDLAERRIPQDGRIKIALGPTRTIDFRVNCCPTLWGEKIVLRILDPSSATLGIDSLGYAPEQKAAYMKALSRPQGMILVTGPTGSGKTVSLYTGLNILNTEDVNISTAEDPAEINMPGVNQVNVLPKVGLTFAAALKAFLRQDPDVIMVGEIRDLETAEIAIKAAQTGHLVLSTLHTNDAPQTLTRLRNMGVPAFNIASSVNLIIAQRLARKLCQHCKQIADIPKSELLREGFTQEEIDAPEFQVFAVKPGGCDRCNDGYKGRTGIYQVMPVSEEMGRIIMEDGNAMTIAARAKLEGVYDLRMSALRKIKEGHIDLLEANRTTVGG